uniref:Uncharacterized protein n=1 Tax=Oryza barthii TaxID=65489 RepID=A0A0D3F4E0_9ORYZ
MKNIRGVAGTLEEEVEVPPLGGAVLQQCTTTLLARPRRGGGARATERKEQAAAIACGARIEQETGCERRSEGLGKNWRKKGGTGKTVEVWVERDAHRRVTMRWKQEDAGRHLSSQDGDRRKRQARRRNSRPRPDGMD